MKKSFYSKLMTLSLLLIATISAFGQTVSTVKTNYTGAQSIVFDNDNNMYVARGTYISKITSAGVESTYATGLTNGLNMAFDKIGNLYCIDYANSKIYKITSAGVVSTFVTTTSPGGIVYDNVKNVLYIANYFAHSISKITMTGTISAFATISGAQRACGLTMDKDSNLYTTDFMGGHVYKISKSGVVSSIATATSGYVAIEYMPSGNLLVADCVNNKIMQLTTAGVTTTYMGTGKGGSNDGDVSIAQFNQPSYSIVDKQGNYFVIDVGSHNIRKITVGNSISISAPNNDYLAWGKPIDIKYTTQGVTNVNIDYNIGTGWTSIASNLASSNGLNTYTYNVPAGTVSVDNCKLRIANTADTSLKAVNNFYLRSKAILLTSPVSGDSVYIGDTLKIGYTISNLAYNVVYSDISYDNGVTWTNIAGDEPTAIGRYTHKYLVPTSTTAASQCKIRVYFSTYSNSPAYCDVQAGTFKIKAAKPKITVTTPTTSTFWRPNNSYYIYWTNSNISGNEKLYYSLNNGTKWNYITQATGYTGSNSYYWSIPSSISGLYSNALISVSNTDSSVHAISNLFTISSISPFTFTNVHAGDTLKAGSYFTVNYTSNSSSSIYAYLSYSLDNGSTWTSYTSNYSYTGSNTMSIYIPVIDSVASKCLFKLYEYSYYTTALSPVFKIMPDPSISITTPSSGTYLTWGENYTITWKSVRVSKVNIDYSSDNGSTWVSIASNVASSNGTNSYAYKVPTGTGSSGYTYLRVSDASNSNLYAKNYFYKIDRVVSLVSPDGGESVAAGDTLKINYTINNSSYNYYYFDISYDNGASWNYLGYNYINSSGTYTYNYIIPLLTKVANNCKVRVSYNQNYASPAYCDISAGIFQIKAAASRIIVTTPAAGAFYRNNQYLYMYWTSIGCTSVNIYYSLNDGASWINISNGVTSSDQYSNSYSWHIPSAISGFNNKARIKIESALNTTINNISNTFILTDQNPVICTKPVKGAKWYAGGTYSIGYTNRSNSQISVNAYVSSDNTTWSSIGYGYPNGNTDGTLSWSIPIYQTGSKNYKIKLYDSYNGLNSYSDTFEIVAAPAQLKVTGPTAGIYFKSATSTNIYWTSVSVTQVKLEYSKDGGSAWSMIIDNIASSNGTTNYYNWTIPSLIGVYNNCLVRITSKTDAAVIGVTDVFTISDRERLQITNPIATTNVKAGDTITVSYRNNGNTIYSYFYLYYSADGGSSWNSTNWNFYGMPTGDGSAQMSIPSNLNDNTNFQVAVATSNPSYADYKAASPSFKLTGLPPVITITSPKAKDYLVSGKYTYIYWNSLHSNYVKIEYTKDGTTWNLITSSAYTYDGNNNSYNWYPPAIGNQSDICQVRITDVSKTTISSTSPKFTISDKSPIKIINPNGNDTLKAGSPYIINIKNNGSDVECDLYYSESNNSRNYIGYIPAGSTSYLWNVPNNIPESNKYKLIVEEQRQYTTDTSDNYFYIKGAKPEIKVTTPYIGSVLWSKDYGYIYFNIINVAKVDIDYSLNGGTTLINVAKNISAGYGSNSYYWQVPTITGKNDNVVVKVHSSADTTIFGLSGKFTINNTPASFKIISPNGGEIFTAGSNVTVQVNNSGHFSNANIYYSTNKGKNWLPISTGTRAYNGINTYNWNILDSTSTSTTCLVRVDSAQQSKAQDTSDAVFTIKAALPNISLSSPSSGSWWISGNNYSVSWNCLNVKSSVIEYSIDAGSTWRPIDTIDSKYGYNYTTIKAPTVDKLYPNSVIRVRSYSDASVYGTSGVLSISKSNPVITVNSPNGGEVYTAGNNLPITLSNEGGSTSVAIYLSVDSGSTWNVIDDYQYIYNGKNSTSWFMPYYTNTSTKAKIKVVPSGSFVGDASDKVFTIKAVDPLIAVTSPKANDLLWSSDSYSIYWNSAHVDNVSLYYSIDSMGSWKQIALHQVSVDGSNYYSWTVPTITGKAVNSFIKIVNDANDKLVGISALFTISNEPAKIKITKPNGGEIYKAGDYMYVYYDYFGRSASSVSNNIYLSTDNGKTKSFIGTDSYVYNGSNSYSFYLSTDLKTSDKCRIYVQGGTFDQPVKDSSDAPFTIKEIPPSITNVYLSNNYLVSGQVYTLYWSTLKIDSVKLYYSTDNGTNWSKLSTNTIKSNGSYDFIAPNLIGNYDKTVFKVVSSVNTAINGISSNVYLSNVPFTIKVIKPNGGEKFQAGKSYLIKFSKNGPVNYNYGNLYYTLDNGYSYNSFGSVDFDANNNAEYNWQISELFASKSCKIKITYSNNAYSDESDSAFEITPAAPHMNITTPNSSSYWIKGDIKTINWNSVSINKVKVQYTLDGGDNWTDLVSSTASYNGTNNLNIQVPSVDSTILNAKIRLIDLAGISDTAVSSVFIIGKAAPSLTIVKPNGGETFKTGTTTFVEFKYTGAPISYVQVYYSSNGWDNWQNIGYVYKVSEGSYSIDWNISSTADISNYYKIKLVSSNSNISDLSDAAFKVVSGKPELTISTPNSFSYLNGGASQDINWNAVNISAVNIEYTLDAGVTWNSISSNYTCNNGSNYYTWTVPAITGTFDNSHIRITSVDNSKLYIISKSFVVSDVPLSLKVLSPNGKKDTLFAGKYYNVKFQNNGPAITSYVDIYLNHGDESYGTWLNSAYNISNGKNIVEVKIPDVSYGDSTYKIKIISNNSSDLSDTAFNLIGIKPLINKVSPDSTAYWSANDDREFSWQSFNIDSVKLEYSIDGAKNWIVIENRSSSNGWNYYNWNVPDVKSTTKKTQIRISSVKDAKVNALSGIFTLSGNPIVITLTYPNGGETMKAGKTDTLRFDYTADSKSLRAYISYDNGANWSVLYVNNYIVNDSIKYQNEYFEGVLGKNKIPFMLDYSTVPSTKCLVRLIDEGGIADTSNAVFSVVEPDPTIKVNAPDTGNYWISKSVHSVSWFNWKVKKVNLEYTINKGTTWVKIRSNVPTTNGDNLYNWSIPTISGTYDAKLRVVSITDSKVFGISKTFTLTDVQPSITISNPKKGDTKQAGVIDSVKFTYVGPTSSAGIYFSADSGATWNLLVDNIRIIKGNNAVAIKLPIATSASSLGFIKVIEASGVSGISGLFIIKAAPASIVVNSPSAKAYLISGNKATIGWESYSVDSVKIEYSLDNGKTWTSIANKVLASNGINSYNWYVVNVTEVKRASLIRITNAGDSKIADTSAVFTINNKYPSTDVRLTEIDINGKAIANFNSETTSYDYMIPFSSVKPPKVTAVTSFANASYIVNDAAHLNGTTSITVTAEDGVSMRVYNVNFTKNKVSSNALLANLRISGKTIAGFKSNTYIYKVILAAGTTSAPSVFGIAADTTAKVTTKTTTTLPWITTISVTAEDGKTKATYEVDFTVTVDVQIVAARSISIYPNPVMDNLTIANAENAKIYIYNLNGQMVKAINNVDKFASIDFSSFSPGTYVLRIMKGNAITEKKIIKLK